MTAQTQLAALQCADRLEHSIAHHGKQDAFTANAFAALKLLRTQHVRITELESALINQLLDSRTTITDEACDRLIAALCPDFSDARFPGDRNTLRQMAREALQ